AFATMCPCWRMIFFRKAGITFWNHVLAELRAKTIAISGKVATPFPSGRSGPSLQARNSTQTRQPARANRPTAAVHARPARASRGSRPGEGRNHLVAIAGDDVFLVAAVQIDVELRNAGGFQFPDLGNVLIGLAKYAEALDNIRRDEVK